MADHSFWNTKPGTVSFQAQSRFKPLFTLLKEQVKLGIGSSALCVFKGSLQECYSCLNVKASLSALQKLSLQTVEGPKSCGHTNSNASTIQVPSCTEKATFPAQENPGPGSDE